VPQFSRKTRLPALRYLRCHDSGHVCIVLEHSLQSNGGGRPLRTRGVVVP
jgi:hypothetical protein